MQSRRWITEGAKFNLTALPAICKLLLLKVNVIRSQAGCSYLSPQRTFFLITL